MKQRTAIAQKDLDDIATTIKGLGGHLPLVISVTEGRRIRSEAQNARYWATLTQFLELINQKVSAMADHTGYTDMEMRKIIAAELPPEHIAILYVRTAEAAHEVMKMICGIPTSTRLGTKAFSRFEETLEQTMSEILGNINAIDTVWA